MSELRAGTPERERMLRAKMIGALAVHGIPLEEATAVADAFVRMSRPARDVEPAQQSEFAL